MGRTAVPEACQPSKLLLKLSRQLFADPAGQAAFIAALTQPTAAAPCLLWTRGVPQPPPFAALPPLPWQPGFVERLADPNLRPGQDPLHAQGAYYCLDFASIFEVIPLLGVPAEPECLIDLCAAPGGKSIFAWRARQPQRLICNEVIGKRLGMLISNLQRCRVQPVVVTNLDSQGFATHAPQTADLVLVDAPCSGQSLLAKGGKAPGCFHPATINQNANRQRRIIANAAQLVAPQGHLLYTTCTFSVAENEQVIAWLLQKFPQFQPVAVPILENYQSHLSALPCYRLWPQSGLGAGGFTALLQNTAIGTRQFLATDWLTGITRWSGD